jgi:hypothetical protein
VPSASIGKLYDASLPVGYVTRKSVRARLMDSVDGFSMQLWGHLKKRTLMYV